MSNKQLPVLCPSCAHQLHVAKLGCESCNTAVEGNFSLPALARLESDDQTFVLNLVKSSGSLKDLARLYGVSYPTVRNRLDTLINKIQQIESTYEY